jgi:hypothetical protein
MVVRLENFFIEQLEKCPIEFQLKFRKIYQQLKIVDKPLEVKGIFRNKLNKNNYKLIIDESRISLNYENDILTLVCFYFNQYFERNEY